MGAPGTDRNSRPRLRRSRAARHHTPDMSTSEYTASGSNEVERSPSTRTFEAFVAQHIALLIPLGIVVIAVLKVFAFSRWNLPVALEIIGVGNRTDVLVATLLEAIIAVVPIVILTSQGRKFAFAGASPDSALIVKIRSALLIIVVAPVLLFALDVSILIALVVLIILELVLYLRRRRGRRSDPATAAKRKDLAIWVALLSLTSLLSTTLTTPWTPTEVLTSKGKSVTVGYVMGDQAGSLFVVGYDGRPAWLPVDHLQSRALCSEPAEAAPWFLQHLSTLLIPDHLQKCPTIKP